MIKLNYVLLTVSLTLLGCRTAGPASRIDRSSRTKNCDSNANQDCVRDSGLKGLEKGDDAIKPQNPSPDPIVAEKTGQTPAQMPTAEGKIDPKVTPTPVPQPSNPTLPLITCTINPKREWWIFSHFVVAAPEFSKKQSNTLNFPADAVDFQLQVVGVYADDYSPKVKINGSQVVNITEGWRKSYASPIKATDVSALMLPGANLVEGEVTDITGTVGQHLGVGLCFSGSYKASKCLSPIEGPDAGYKCGQ